MVYKDRYRSYKRESNKKVNEGIYWKSVDIRKFSEKRIKIENLKKTIDKYLL